MNLLSKTYKLRLVCMKYIYYAVLSMAMSYEGTHGHKRIVSGCFAIHRSTP